MDDTRRVGQAWRMSFSRVRQVVGLVVGWSEGSAAHRVVDLENGREFLVGELSFESDPWWRRIA